jgi:hypothetical protein
MNQPQPTTGDLRRFAVRPVGQRVTCELVARTGRHEVNWTASDTADLVSYGLGERTDAMLTVSLARCRTCETPLLLLGPSADETAYAVVLEVTGAGIGPTSDPTGGIGTPVDAAAGDQLPAADRCGGDAL